VVLIPEPGFLWTPGYWGWGDGAFIFHEGYWGPHIGFYGGINYGFGYVGFGYEGSRNRSRSTKSFRKPSLIHQGSSKWSKGTSSKRSNCSKDILASNKACKAGNHSRSRTPGNDTIALSFS
jgi:hypothetical protein